MRATHASAPEVLSLPTGGGAARSIGDTFSPDLFTGAGRYDIPLWFPHGPGGFQPGLVLGWTSQHGHGPFGLGWSLGVLALRRRTDRGIPTYDDDVDTLLLEGQALARVDGGWRPLVEGSFPRVLRVGDGWEVTDRSGRTSTLGTTPSARVEAADGSGRTVAWLPEQVRDPRGNVIGYAWLEDGGQRYLQTITYGRWVVRFHYGARPDQRTDRRAGFPITTALRCEHIDYELDGVNAPAARSYELTYEQAPLSGLSRLAEVRLVGRRLEGGGVASATLPPLRFTYADFALSPRLRTIRSEVDAPPPTLRGAARDLVPLDADGLPGVIELDGPVRRYWPNRGAGRWGAPRTLRALPHDLDLRDRAVALADIDGTGTADAVLLAAAPLGYLPNVAGEGFQPRARFTAAPSFDPADGRTRLVDLTGDGRSDVLHTSDNAFVIWFNEGGGRWSRPVAIPRLRDRALFPDVDLSDERVRFSDMSGDGLLDLVQVFGSTIVYWPSLGGGRFGARVRLSLSPAVPQGFEPSRLKLADIDGSGCADVMYLADDGIQLWINQGGHALVHAGRIRHTPPGDGREILAVDMVGAGVAGLLWTGDGPRAGVSGYHFLELATGVRANLVTGIANGLGAHTAISWQTATAQAVASADEGQPWADVLPFALHVVSAIEVDDTIRGSGTRRTLRYRDGFFDGRAREFRGFRQVEVDEEGDVEVPGARSISVFHQGRTGLGPGSTATERQALRGRLERLEVWALDGTGSASALIRRELNTWEVRQLAPALDGRPVLQPHLTLARVESWEGGAAPQVLERFVDFDTLGNISSKEERWTVDGVPQVRRSEYRYTADTARWLLDLPVEHEERDGTGALLRLRRWYYDGPDFVGLPLGSVTKGKLSRVEELAYTDAMLAAAGLAGVVDPATLGYHPVVLPDGTSGWATHSLRQRHDARGNVVGMRDALGHSGTMTYDAAGTFPVAIEDASGQPWQCEYDPGTASVAHLVEPNGHESRYLFDPVGRLVAVVHPGDSEALPTARFEHTDVLPVGVLRQLREVSGQPGTIDAVNFHDGSGEVIQQRSAAEDGQVIVDGWRRYNRRGWEIERAPRFLSNGMAYVPGEGSASPQLYRFTHDAMGRVVETHAPEGTTSRAVWEVGQVTRYEASDTDLSPENVARRHADTPRIERVDAAGRLYEQIEQDEVGVIHTTRYTYDVLGRVVAIEDARGIELGRYTRDLLGRVLAVDHVDAGSRRALHDARGDLAWSRDGDGRVVQVRYDAVRRKVEVESQGSVVEQYTYDVGVGSNLAGRLARVEDEAGSVELSYSARGLVTEHHRTVQTAAGPESFTVRYAYDALTRMVSVTRPDGSVTTYDHDGRGLVSAISGVIGLLTRNAQGQEIRREWSNGVVEQRMVSPASFTLDELRIDDPGGTALLHERFTRDASGNPLTVEDLVTTPGHEAFERAFTYDARGRLRTATGTADGTPFAHEYRHDAVGNFTLQTERGPEELVVAGNSNRLHGISVGGIETQLYAHDGSGRIVSAPGRICIFDARGRLVEVTRDDGTVVRLTYGYDGARVRRKVQRPDGTTGDSVYVADVYERHDGVVHTFVVYQGGRIAHRQGAGGLRYYHHDARRNVVLVTDVAGTVLRRTGWFPFGTMAFTQGEADRYGFIDRERDESTGLVYAGARHYDPALGRFISPDPLILFQPDKAIGDPSLFNLYVYASNNPLRQVDDNGTFWKWLVGALIIVALVVSTVVVGVVTGGSGFAFGILLAASVGSALGAGIGVYAAYQAGGDLADGFLFGAIVGAAAGAAGYAAGAAVGAAGISGVWGSILAGAAEGAVIGMGNGAIIGYAGGEGSVEDIFLNIGIGFVAGAVLGGLAGYIRFDPSFIGEGITKSLSTGTFTGMDAAGNAISQTYSTGLSGIAPGIGNATQQFVYALSHPIVFAPLGSMTQLAIRFHWDELKAAAIKLFGGEEREIIISGPSVDF